MAKFLSLIAAVLFGLVSLVTDPVVLMHGELAISTAAACQVNCGPVTAVKKGTKVPVWTVLYCVIGPAGGPYQRIGCKDKGAVHTAPTGNQAVCFYGSDGKIHWDYQWAVAEGNRFINRRVSGRWQPDWQS